MDEPGHVGEGKNGHDCSFAAVAADIESWRFMDTPAIFVLQSTIIIACYNSFHVIRGSDYEAIFVWEKEISIGSCW